MVSMWWFGLLGLAAVTAAAGEWLQHRLGTAADDLDRRRQALRELRPALAGVRSRSAELAERNRGVESHPG